MTQNILKKHDFIGLAKAVINAEVEAIEALMIVWMKILLSPVKQYSPVKVG